MIGARFLAWCAIAAPIAIARSTQETQPTATGVTARLTSEPAQAEIGEPLRWTLTVEHPATVTVHLPDKELVPDDSWVLLEPQRVLRTPSPGDRITTRATWSVASLEPGSRALPRLTVAYEVGGAHEAIAADAGVADIRAVLAEGEDAPRPPRGFLPPPEGASGRSAWPWIGGATLLLAALGIWRWRARRRTQVAAARVPTPLEQLEVLAQRAKNEPESLRAMTYALAHLLRDAVDAHVGEAWKSATDIEWLARIEPDERIPFGVRSACARILREAEAVKYALVPPTPFAWNERLESARVALIALAAAPAVQRAIEEAA